MPDKLSLPAFVAKWQQSTLNERAGAQQYFLELCDVLDVDRPSGDAGYVFEADAPKAGGGGGKADVWKRGFFAWEYKSKGADLAAAHLQLVRYSDALDHPPLLIACDFDRFEVHTNVTNTTPRVYRFTLADLLTTAPVPGSGLKALEVLRLAFTYPDRLQPVRSSVQVTQEAARQFAKLAASLRKQGHDPQAAAHYLIQLLFCLFAEDAGLLPERLFSRLVENTRPRPWDFDRRVGTLFEAMRAGGDFGEHVIRRFNGGLFAGGKALPLIADDLDILAKAAALDWRDIEPSIFGTLFERGLDPGSRAQLGAHYTSRDDIDTVIEPVLMAPLRREWDARRAEAEALIARRDASRGREYRRHQQAIERIVYAMTDRVAGVRVLDPACGSGNFLYVALLHLLDFEHEVNEWAFAHGCQRASPRVKPEQLYGIEVNEYARELAQAVVWIGDIQWWRKNQGSEPSEPILRPLDNIRRMDAILARDEAGALVEPEWPEADAIVGNPPFLGDKKMRAELGDAYVEDLRRLYSGRVPGGADLVCYWFERAREAMATGKAKRAGLLATNSIRQPGNRPVLERIKANGDIFWAWADREWVLDGAAVRVSMVGFDAGEETMRTLDGRPVPAINADLTGASDLTTALPLPENAGLCFLGMMKAGPFDIDGDVARTMLAQPTNVNGRTNCDVVRRRLGGQDVTGRPKDGWVVDFAEMGQDQAACYEMPFEHVVANVKPIRDQNRRERTRRRWWLYGENRPGLRRALAPLKRCIVTPEVAKHRLFVWMGTDVVPDHTLHVIAREDDWTFGVLQARPHEVWSLAQGARMGVGNDPRYSSTRTFETYPMPPNPLSPTFARDRQVAMAREGGTNAHDRANQSLPAPGRDADRQGEGSPGPIAEAARRLVALRDAWLNPPGASEDELKQRTLTKLYNARPTWLAQAHEALDRAVFAAYGWPWPLTDEEILARLLALNRERAGGA